MSNYYKDFNSKKNLILALTLCVVFFLIIIKAYQYLPEEAPVEKTNSVKIINQPTVNVAQDENEEEQEDVVPEKKTLNVNLTKTNDGIDELEPLVSSEEQNEQQKQVPELTPVEKAMAIMSDGLRYKDAKQYTKAIEEFQKIDIITDDTKMVSKSYEEIATIYAIVKRYGTALAYAQKAYNMNPSSSREMLLARLYYKTGDIDKATMRINNVLQRDFSDDR